MRQNTLFGGATLELTNDRKIKTEVGSLVPTLSVGVEEVYREAQLTFDLVQELMPEVQHEIIRTEKELYDYLEAIKESKVYAIDTEVDGLNPRQDRIAGICIYTPSKNPAYIPINHEFYEYNLDARDFVRKLSELDTFSIMHTSEFDQRVLYNYAQVWVPVSLDVSVGAHMLNENEPKGLKYQWNKYCMNGQYTEKSYGDLFGGRKFSTFDPERVMVYATLDAIMTYQLGAFQMQYLNPKQKKCSQHGLESVAKAVWEIEMPVRRLATKMEERGINYDMELNRELQVKYEKRIREEEQALQEYLDKLMPVIEDRISPSGKAALDNPINLSSNKQLQVILYEGMGLEISESLKKGADVKHRKKKTASPVNYKLTGGEALEYFIEEYPTYESFFKSLLAYRELNKVYGTYIIGMRKKVDPYSKRIHGRWLTTGTDTGRFSSREPNLQNIPGRNADIRPTFIPTEGKVFVGVDYS